MKTPESTTSQDGDERFRIARELHTQRVADYVGCATIPCDDARIAALMSF